MTTIKGVLGHGGFGIVYEACHSELNHLASIKSASTVNTTCARRHDDPRQERGYVGSL